MKAEERRAFEGEMKALEIWRIAEELPDPEIKARNYARLNTLRTLLGVRYDAWDDRWFPWPSQAPSWKDKR